MALWLARWGLRRRPLWGALAAAGLSLGQAVAFRRRPPALRGLLRYRRSCSSGSPWPCPCSPAPGLERVPRAPRAVSLGARWQYSAPRRPSCWSRRSLAAWARARWTALEPTETAAAPSVPVVPVGCSSALILLLAGWLVRQRPATLPAAQLLALLPLLPLVVTDSTAHYRRAPGVGRRSAGGGRGASRHLRLAVSRPGALPAGGQLDPRPVAPRRRPISILWVPLGSPARPGSRGEYTPLAELLSWNLPRLPGRHACAGCVPPAPARRCCARSPARRASFWSPKSSGARWGTPGGTTVGLVAAACTATVEPARGAPPQVGATRDPVAPGGLGAGRPPSAGPPRRCSSGSRMGVGARGGWRADQVPSGVPPPVAGTGSGRTAAHRRRQSLAPRGGGAPGNAAAPPRGGQRTRAGGAARGARRRHHGACSGVATVRRTLLLAAPTLAVLLLAVLPLIGGQREPLSARRLADEGVSGTGVARRRATADRSPAGRRSTAGRRSQRGCLYPTTCSFWRHQRCGGSTPTSGSMCCCSWCGFWLGRSWALPRRRPGR